MKRIDVRNVSKRFRVRGGVPPSLKSVLVNALRGKFISGNIHEFQVLDDVSFSISEGEFVGIMGRNGAGKSTLLKLICGIYQPTSGEIEVNGTLAPLIELGAGFNEELSGYENIFLNAAILGFGRDVTLAALDDIIAFSELGEHIEMPVRTYSSGMLVRLGFSIATHLEAPVLLVDEVLAVGDAGFQAKCLNRIRQLHEAGRTIVLVTHDSSAVKDHCQRCIVIDGHKKVFDGNPHKGPDIYLGAVGGQPSGG